ncbi:uncharacterized protein O3C94_019598 [Discoglossus pictus]
MLIQIVEIYLCLLKKKFLQFEERTHCERFWCQNLKKRTRHCVYSNKYELFFLVDHEEEKSESRRGLRGAFSDTEEYLDHGLVSSLRCASRTSSIGSWSECIKPSFTQKLTFRSVLEGEPAVFRCKLVASPTPKVSWFHNNRPVAQDARRLIKTDSDMHIHNCSLLIKHVEDRDSGSYRIFAINSEGSAECTASMLVALREEQNLKYLDFVKYSEKTHESIDSLVQKRREARLKVDLRCVGSPHDKRRETQILRGQYPKKGIVRTISFENLTTISSQDKSSKIRQSKGEKLLDKEIHQKLQKLREFKRGKRERGSLSVSSSEAYSDVDLESFLSDTSSTSWHIEKEKYRITTSEISDHGDSKYKQKMDILKKSPEVQDQIKESKQELSETWLIGSPDKEDIQQHSSKTVGKISFGSGFKIYMKESEEKKVQVHPDFQEESKLVDVESGSGNLFEKTVGLPVENYEVELELPALKEAAVTTVHSVESKIKNRFESTEKSQPCPPMFVCDVESQEVLEGQVCTFICHFRGYPQPTVSWYNNNNSVQRNEECFVSTTDTKSTLTFYAVLPKHEGSITCVIFNQYGTDTTFGNLKVKKQDRDMTESLIKCEVLVSKDVNEGEEEEELVSLFESNKEKQKSVRNTDKVALQLPLISYGLPCKSETSLTLPVEIKIIAPTPVPEYEEVKEYFQPDEVPPESQDSSSQKMKHKFKFSFDVANKAPRIIQDIEKQVECKEGDCVLLKCVISGDPKPTIIWYRNNTALERSNKFIFQEADDVCELFIKGISSFDSGEFKCVAKNRAGEVESVSEIIVRDESYISFVDDTNDQKIETLKMQETENVQCHWESSIRHSTEISNNIPGHFVSQHTQNVRKMGQGKYEENKPSTSRTEVDSNVQILLRDNRKSKHSEEKSVPTTDEHRYDKKKEIKEEIIGVIHIDQSHSASQQIKTVSKGRQKEEQQSSISRMDVESNISRDTENREFSKETFVSKIQHKYGQQGEIENKVTGVSHADQSQWESSFDQDIANKVNVKVNAIGQLGQNVSNVWEEELKENKPVTSVTKLYSNLPTLRDTRKTEIQHKYDKEGEVEKDLTEYSHVNQSQWESSFDHSKDIASNEKVNAIGQLGKKEYNTSEGELKEHTPVTSRKKVDSNLPAFMQDIMKAKHSDLKPVSKTHHYKYEKQSKIKEEIMQTIHSDQIVSQREPLIEQDVVGDDRKYSPRQQVQNVSNISQRGLEEHKPTRAVKEIDASLPTFISDIRESDVSLEKPVPKIQHYNNEKLDEIKKDITGRIHTDQSHSQMESSFGLNTEIFDKERVSVSHNLNKESHIRKGEPEEQKPSFLMKEIDSNIPIILCDIKESELTKRVSGPKIPYYRHDEEAAIQKEITISIHDDQSHSEMEASFDHSTERTDKDRVSKHHDLSNLSNIRQVELEEHKASLEGKGVNLHITTLKSDMKMSELVDKQSLPKIQHCKYDEEMEILKEITISTHDDLSNIQADASLNYSTEIPNKESVPLSHDVRNVSDVRQVQLEEDKDLKPKREEEVPTLISDIKELSNKKLLELYSRESISETQHYKYENDFEIQNKSIGSVHDNQSRSEIEYSSDYGIETTSNEEKSPISQHVKDVSSIRQVHDEHKSSISIEEVNTILPTFLSDIKQSELSSEKSVSETQHEKYEKQSNIEIIDTDQGKQSLVNKELEHVEVAKELPTIPRRRRSVVKAKSVAEAESRTVVEETVTIIDGDQSQGSILKETEQNNARKELPVIPKRRRSIVKTKFGTETESKPVGEESITRPSNVDYSNRPESAGAGVIESRKELPTPPRRKRSFTKNKPGADTLSKSIEVTTVNSETDFVESRAKDNVGEYEKLEVLKDTESVKQIHLSEPTIKPSTENVLYVKAAAVLENQIQTKEETSEKEVFSAEDIVADHATAKEVVCETSKENTPMLNQLSHDVEATLMSKNNVFNETCSSNNRLLAHLTELVPKNDIEDLEETREGEQPLTVSPTSNLVFISTTEEQSSKTTITGSVEPSCVEQEPPFSLTEYLISTGEQEVVKPTEESPKEHITTLEVEDVTFSAFYDFYKNQSLINRSLSPESEISVEACSVSSDDVLDLDQFYTPPSSAECFHSPLSEHFQTPPSSPERFFTPVEQISDFSDVKMAKTFERAATMYTQPVQARECNPKNIKSLTKLEEPIENEMPPAFIKPLPKKRVYENNTLTFAVEITGLPAPDVEWYRNSLLLEADERNKIDREGNMYILEICNMQLNESGEYLCHAMNSVGEAKSVTIVEVLSQEGRSIALPPPVTHQHVMEFDMEPYTTSRSPSPQEILLEVELDESAVQDFEKQVKIITIPEFSPDSKSMVISLDVLPLAYDEQSLGTNIRDSEDVKIDFEVAEIPPRFVQPLSNLNIPEDSDAQFICSVAGLPSPTVKWFRENRNILTDVRKYLIKEKDGQHSLIILNVNRSDVGCYVCKAENTFGEVSCKAMLQVIDVDVAKELFKEMEQIPLEGDRSMISDLAVQVDNTVPNSNQTEIELEIEFEGNISDANKSLELVAVTEKEHDESGEKCINVNVDLFAKPLIEEDIEFKAEDSESCCFEFQVTEAPPKFKTELLNQTASLGTPGCFQCVVIGSPLPSVTWYKDDELIQGSKYIIEEETPGFHKLIIKNVESNDEGTYKCLASNKDGIVESSALLKLI